MLFPAYSFFTLCPFILANLIGGLAIFPTA
jgi:hypothetical protein